MKSPLDVSNKSLETPLMWAARLNSTDMTLLFLQTKADLDSKDINGNTALDIAKREENKEGLDY